MSVILRSEGADWRLTPEVQCASVSSNGARRKPPNARPPRVDFFKKLRRLFSPLSALSVTSSGFSFKPSLDKNFSDGVMVAYVLVLIVETKFFRQRLCRFLDCILTYFII